MKKTPSTVAASIPEMTAVPSMRRAAAPAPVATHKGMQPAMNANDVIRIGRRRSRAPSSAASTIDPPCSSRSFANSTIKMAFLAVRPTSITRPICAYTLLSKRRDSRPR